MPRYLLHLLARLVGGFDTSSTSGGPPGPSRSLSLASSFTSASGCHNLGLSLDSGLNISDTPDLR